jgi:rhamnose transport system ATP-binding protein
MVDRDKGGVAVVDVCKSFGATRAVRSASLTIARGSVHALVGENGAGKSTLAKIVAGITAPDDGHVLVDGVQVAFGSPRDALSHGIAAMAQELLIVPGLSVAENVLLGAEPRRGGFVRRRALREQFRALAATAGFELPADELAGRISIARRQELEILRALARDARLVVMDEPSSRLSAEETSKLHSIIRSLADQGRSVLLVSHFLREVLDLADTVTVMRDGAVVRTAPAAEETEASLVEGMIGRSLGAQFPPKSPPARDAQVALSVRALSAAGVADVSFELRAGEILGLAGLVGSGRSEVARALFGADRVAAGDVIVRGVDHRPRAPRDAIRHGLAMIPESRQQQGLVLTRSVGENVSLPSLGAMSSAGALRTGRERRLVGGVLKRVACSARQRTRVAALSGGNQQKVLFARSTLCAPRVLLADEPSRGVDVGAKREIYDLIVSLADEGLAVLLISSEMEELLGLAHRVLVMREGRIVGELEGDEMTEASITTAAFGLDRRAA